MLRSPVTGIILTPHIRNYQLIVMASGDRWLLVDPVRPSTFGVHLKNDKLAIELETKVNKQIKTEGIFSEIKFNTNVIQIDARKFTIENVIRTNHKFKRTAKLALQQKINYKCSSKRHL